MSNRASVSLGLWWALTFVTGLLLGLSVITLAHGQTLAQPPQPVVVQAQTHAPADLHRLTVPAGVAHDLIAGQLMLCEGTFEADPNGALRCHALSTRYTAPTFWHAGVYQPGPEQPALLPQAYLEAHLSPPPPGFRWRYWGISLVGDFPTPTTLTLLYRQEPRP